MKLNNNDNIFFILTKNKKIEIKLIQIKLFKLKNK